MQLLDLLSLNALLVLFEFIYQSSPDYNWQKAQLHTRHQRERDREKNKKQTDLETAGLTAKFWLTAALLHPSLELDGGGEAGIGAWCKLIWKQQGSGFDQRQLKGENTGHEKKTKWKGN